MPVRLDAASAEFETAFQALLTAKREASEDVGLAVREIIQAVRSEGDAAVYRLTEKYDQIDLSRDGLAVGAKDFAAAREAADPDTVAALEFAAERIRTHHARQLPSDDSYTDAIGVQMGSRWTPVESAGLYVPGGTASYPSSVLMNAIPAIVAGVKRIAMVVPMPRGDLNPLVLVAAQIAGVSEIYRIGGAQAVAALAYGTETIKPVTKIVGPGNAYVAAAKREVFGTVGIDMIAGPSEVLILADAQNDPAWIAADLLAQAEHDASAQSILITDNADFANAVTSEVASQLKSLPRGNIAAASWENFGAIILVPDLSDTLTVPAIVDQIAPEHLEIAVQDCEAMSENIRNAGAIFLGRYTPEVIGDYVAGTNHVLPTARSARFSSGLGVLDFMKRTSMLKCSKDSLLKLATPAITLGQAEGLDAHARSVAIRVHDSNGQSGEAAMAKVRDE